jgi:hypothetical protein
MRTRGLILIAVAGCTGTDVEDTAFEPEVWPQVDGVSSPEVLLEGLDTPMGIAACGDDLCVALRGSGEVISLSGALYASGLEGPTVIQSVGLGLAVLDVDGEQVIWTDGASTTVWAESQVDLVDLASQDTAACWSVGKDSGANVTCRNVDSPDEIVLHDAFSGPLRLGFNADGLVVASGQSTGTITQVLENGSREELASFSGPVMDVASFGSDTYYTQQQVNWPSGGWVGRLSESGPVELSYSPPEPEHLVVHPDWVVWSSFQSVTMAPIQGGEYVMLADQVAVGGLFLQDDTLYWTDYKSGKLYRQSIH